MNPTRNHRIVSQDSAFVQKPFFFLSSALPLAVALAVCAPTRTAPLAVVSEKAVACRDDPADRRTPMLRTNCAAKLCSRELGTIQHDIVSNDPNTSDVNTKGQNMNADWLVRVGPVVGALFLARIVGKWRGSKRQKAAMTTPLFDGALLEAVFQPRPRDGDDADLLAEVRDTLRHLNRQAWAEEFWGLNEQITALNAKIGPPQQATLRRALLRLLTANDRWLQLVAAKTAADLSMTEAVLPLRAILEMGDSQTFSASKAEYSSADAVGLRFRKVLEEALATLTLETAP